MCVPAAEPENTLPPELLPEPEPEPEEEGAEADELELELELGAEDLDHVGLAELEAQCLPSELEEVAALELDLPE